ncbi:hypothetical protein [Burkholderia sp. MSMB1589WGS]|uniref:hypothetical protein n=1 Tax=Burkholderia sp. MSMB1589WGS TaxID=1636425 RepID=UPI0007B84A45|nr:hypothetical protein [Burkholderia sp. MSMB1589WGS]
MALKTCASVACVLALLLPALADARADADADASDAARAIAALVSGAAPAQRADFDDDALTGLGVASLRVLAYTAEDEVRRTFGVDLAQWLDTAWATLLGYAGDEHARVARRRRAPA